MPYTKTTWINNNEPPISAQNLNKMEQGIYDNSVAVESVTSLLGGHYVQKDVPANAVFTDTIYDDTEITQRITTAESDIDDLQESTEHLSDGDTVYPYASEIEIEDALGVNAKDVSEKIEPVQDLHGYDHPWAGGAGKNLLPMTVDGIKAVNTSGTWTGNSYELGGVTFTILTDDAGNVTGIKGHGTSSIDWVIFMLDSFTLKQGDYIMNGITTGGGSTYRLSLSTSGTEYNIYDNPTNFSIAADATNSQMRFIVRTAGQTLNNVVVYPMIRLSTETDPTFEPYENNCPISGWDECEVDRVGKNLFDGSKENHGFLASNGSITESAGDNWYYTDYIQITDKVSISTSGAGLGNLPSVVWYDENKNYIGGESYANRLNMSFNLPSTAKYIRVSFYTSWVDTLQIEKSSTATTYEPYKGKTYTIDLNGTIYGGTIDATTGVMTVDRVKDTFTVGTGDYIRNLSAEPKYIKEQTVSCAISDKMLPSYNTTETTHFYFDTNSRISIFNYTGDSLTFDVCYELATPITIQLTSQQIQLLDGYNLISANTGDISITTTDIKGAIGQADALIETNTQAIREIDSLNDSIFGTVENGTTASKAYAQGDYFVKDIKMCKALTSIAQGATFTLGTNYAQYTLAEILKAIEQS